MQTVIKEVGSYVETPEGPMWKQEQQVSFVCSGCKQHQIGSQLEPGWLLLKASVAATATDTLPLLQKDILFCPNCRKGNVSLHTVLDKLLVQESVPSEPPSNGQSDRTDVPAYLEPGEPSVGPGAYRLPPEIPAPPPPPYRSKSARLASQIMEAYFGPLFIPDATEAFERWVKKQAAQLAMTDEGVIALREWFEHTYTPYPHYPSPGTRITPAPERVVIYTYPPGYPSLGESK